MCAALRRAIELEPDQASYHYNLGMLVHCKGQADEAIVELRRAIDLEPKMAPAHYHLARLLSGRGRADEAILEFRATAELDPDGQGSEALADLLLRRGRFADARMAARRGLDLAGAETPRGR